MREIFFFESYYKGLYGAPRSMLDLASGLNNNKNINVTVVTTKSGPLENKAQEVKLNTKVISVPDALLISRSKFGFLGKLLYPFLLFFLWIRQCGNIRKFNHTECICVNDIRSFLFYFPIMLFNRKKVIWYVRINDRVKYISSLAAMLSHRIIFISTDCLTVLSEREKEKYKDKLYILNTGFKFKSLNYYEVNRIKEEIKDIKGRVYVTVGSICQRKNQKDIVKAFSKACNPEDILFIIGSPPSDIDEKYESELISMITDLELTNQIIRVQYTPYVNEYLSISDVFLFASYKEGLPRVVIEALNAGCFICSSLVDGINDIITSDDKGFVTKFKSNNSNFVDEFVSIISSIDDLVLDSRLERNNYVKEKFGYDRFIKGFEDIVTDAKK